MNQASSFIIYFLSIMFFHWWQEKETSQYLFLNCYMQTYYKGGMGHLPVIILWIKVYYHNIIKILSPDLNFQVIQYLTKKYILKIFKKVKKNVSPSWNLCISYGFKVTYTLTHYAMLLGNNFTKEKRYYTCFYCYNHVRILFSL